MLVSILLSCRSVEERFPPESSCFKGDPHPTDAVLIRNFEENRESFELLLRMLREDESVVGLDRKKRLLVNGEALPAGRVEDYVKVAEDAGFCMGFRASPGGTQLEAYVSASGMVTRGSTKRYEYTAEDASRHLVESLDGLSSGYHLRSLGSNWYLVFYGD